MQTLSPNKPKSLKEYYRKADGNCFLGKERGVDGGIHATGDHMSNVF
jgi:hypothetical protein